MVWPRERLHVMAMYGSLTYVIVGLRLHAQQILGWSKLFFSHYFIPYEYSPIQNLYGPNPKTSTFLIPGELNSDFRGPVFDHFSGARVFTYSSMRLGVDDFVKDGDGPAKILFFGGQSTYMYKARVEA